MNTLIIICPTFLLQSYYHNINLLGNARIKSHLDVFMFVKICRVFLKSRLNVQNELDKQSVASMMHVFLFLGTVKAIKFILFVPYREIEFILSNQRNFLSNGYYNLKNIAIKISNYAANK